MTSTEQSAAIEGGTFEGGGGVVVLLVDVGLVDAGLDEVRHATTPRAKIVTAARAPAATHFTM